MTTNYPLSLDNYTDKIDNFHDVMAADVNNLQDAIKAIETVLGAPPDGWLRLPFTLTYVDADTITIAGDVTGYFPPHSKLKLTQGGTIKYFYVVSASYSSPNTTLVIGPWGLYSLANEAISEPQVSYAQNPAGFPLIEDGWLSYPTAWTYASATTFTVQGDVDYFFPAGAKIRLTQGGIIKFFFVAGASYSSPNTTVTVDGRGLYTLSNEAISNPRVALVQHPAGFPLVDDGWIPYPATWTYASTTTFTVPGNVTAHFPVGAKIRLVQSGSTKYFYVVSASYSSPNTTVTVTGGNDYTLANAAISNPRISYAENPQGFPQWFNYTPTPSGFSIPPTFQIANFAVNGRLCIWQVGMNSDGVSNATTFTITAPVASGANGRSIADYVIDNGVAQTTPGIMNNAAGSLIWNIYKNTALGGWTASGNKRADFTVIYQI